MNRPLIAIDSDGCVFDTMTIKHQAFFYPKLIEVFEFEDREQDIYKRWLDINLYQATRGVNRFYGLYLLFQEIKGQQGVTTERLRTYETYIKNQATYNVESLRKWYEETQDEWVGRVLKWSAAVNQAIEKSMPVVEPFIGVRAFLEAAAQRYQIAVVSSANAQALETEWTQSGLIQYVDYLKSQNDGTKAEILAQFIASGIAKENILMIGDAPGDQKAARENGCLFEWIHVGQEQQCFERLTNLLTQAPSTERYNMAMNHILNQVRANLEYFTQGFPHVSENGIYCQEVNRLWTASFFPGMTYLAYKITGETHFLKNRQAYLESFKERCYHGHMDTHDIGFLFWHTYIQDYQLEPKEASKCVIIDAADKLMERYHEGGKFIQAWGKMDEETPSTRIIIDCMMNLEFLIEVSRMTQEPSYAQAAINHAKLSARTLVREDGSTYHTYYIDKKTGCPIEGKTHQGHRDESTWARGQAWSVYGFAKMYQLTQEPMFLDTAIASAKVYIENLPKDFVHYWDFDFTDANPDVRDSSAASIGAAGLLILDECLSEQKTYYATYATQIIDGLMQKYMYPDVRLGGGILKEGIYHRNEGFNEATSWGDYYFLEALMQLRGKNQ